jgi:hypothetical protein
MCGGLGVGWRVVIHQRCLVVLFKGVSFTDRQVHVGVCALYLDDVLTFTQVYKGLWRGTTVAVKTMVLPANMTGAEKREKMVRARTCVST